MKQLGEEGGKIKEYFIAARATEGKQQVPVAKRASTIWFFYKLFDVLYAECMKKPEKTTRFWLPGHKKRSRPRAERVFACSGASRNSVIAAGHRFSRDFSYTRGVLYL